MDLVDPVRAGRTNGGKSKKMEHESTTSSTPVGAAVASLPRKSVVFSPNGEMEKGASASALDITSRDETGWHPLWFVVPGILYS